ncbi:hypothetical protein A3Q56_03276, partial [Intoshia linei]
MNEFSCIKHVENYIKTSRGDVVKKTNLYHLRSNIPCGIYDKCIKCYPITKPKPINDSIISNEKMYIFPDYSAIRNQFDVIENLKNVVICGTVYEKLKKKSFSIFKRLLCRINNDNTFYCFANENFDLTFTDFTKHETTEKRNLRAVIKARDYICSHMNVDGYVVTNDIELYKNVMTEKFFTIYDFIVDDKNEIQHSFGDLSDKLIQLTNYLDKDQEKIYDFHLENKTMFEKILKGVIYKGKFSVTSHNRNEATVRIGEDEIVYVFGLLHMNRAIDGDTVAVEVLPEDNWKVPSNLVVDEAFEKPIIEFESENVEMVDSNKCIKKSNYKSVKIVGILKRKYRHFCGALMDSLTDKQRSHLVRPINRKIPFIRIETKKADVLRSQRIVVSIDEWLVDSKFPRGHFIRCLGAKGDKATENELLLIECDINYAPFSQSVLACLPKDDWKITEPDLVGRKDFRNKCIVSVDPPGCTDIDDALHIELHPDSTIEIGVHIADVSYYIKPNTYIDREACVRASTVYLIDRRIDMIPERLSSDLCSLKCGVDRLAFSTIWTLDKDYNIINTVFTKSVIKSKASLTYEQAQKRIDVQAKNDKSNDEISNSLFLLNKIAKTLRKTRIDSGALMLQSSEQFMFFVDETKNHAIDVQLKSNYDTNAMVEEYMLLANISVAKKIHSVFPNYAILRRHPVPSAADFKSIVEIASSKGFDFDCSSNKSIAESFKKMSTSKQVHKSMIILTMKCLKEALYFSSGCEPESAFKHFGLATDIYTHFTSPIRRYADMMVHRLLSVAIGMNNPDIVETDKNKLKEICANLNYRTSMARKASRDSARLHTLIFFRDKILRETANILYIRKNAIQIVVNKYGLEGNIFLDKLNLSVPVVHDET